jgi:hypothetical protein
MTEDELDANICPLCVEEMDASDKNFLPCPCGYRVDSFISYLFNYFFNDFANLIYDRYACGVGIILEKISMDYVLPAELHTIPIRTSSRL